jgi:hypothetical protein
MEDYVKSDFPFLSAQLLVRTYYFFLFYASVVVFSPWDISISAETQVTFMPAIAWLKFVSFPIGFALIRTSFIVSSLLASLAPQWRLVRIFSFVSILEFVSLYMSILQLDVDWYALLLTSLLLIFLPDGWGNPFKFPKIERQKFLLVFWGCQALNLLTYTMAGMGKINGAVNQILRGESHAFDIKAGALHIADRLILTDQTSFLGPWVVENYLVAWPFFLGSIYLLLFSFLIAFRPRMHRIWGLSLILFHVSNYLLINIGFSAHIYILSILLIASPFAPVKVGFYDAIREFPILGLIVTSLSRRRNDKK